MKIAKMIRDIEKVLHRDCVSFEKRLTTDETGIEWVFSLEDSVIGIMNYDENKDLGIPTVSIALSLGDVAEMSNEELFDLFYINGNFYHASFTVYSSPENDWRTLYLQYKTSAEGFNPDDFLGCIAYLVEQAELYIPEDIMSSQDAGDLLLVETPTQWASQKALDVFIS